VLELVLLGAALGITTALAFVLRSHWARVTIGCFWLTIGFMVFYGAVPSAMMQWTDNWDIVKENSGGTNLGPRIRDIFVMGYQMTVVGLTFFGFAIYQRLKPVNADADEAKRDAGGYR
jgi:hypothetical protein